MPNRIEIFLIDEAEGMLVEIPDNAELRFLPEHSVLTVSLPVGDSVLGTRQIAAFSNVDTFRDMQLVQVIEESDA